MMNMSLRQAAQWLPKARLVGNPDIVVQRVHSDTRSLQVGDLFVALSGDRFDAHDFLPQAKQQGAVAALAAHGLQAAGLPGLEVDAPLAALGQLSAGWRAQFSLPLIAVTGSNGKTTVTQMIAGILQAWTGGNALSTQGNLNNDIGVPLTLLRLRAGHTAAVVELGMNHPGEIARLAAWTQPTVALVNNAQREHLEFMHTVQAVADENGAVLGSLGADGVAVFPADDAYSTLWHALANGRRTLTFALDDAQTPATEMNGEQPPKADVTAQAQWQGGAWHVGAQTPQGPCTFVLQVAGRHNVKNALAAISCALAAGAPLAAIAAGLTAFSAVRGRSRTVALQCESRSITLIDDTYNANPDSMAAALALLAELPGPRLLVMGDMGEVGDQGPLFHVQAGELALALGIERVMTIGTLAKHAAQGFANAEPFENMPALLAAVRVAVPRVGSVVVKGARFMQMERVVQVLEQEFRSDALRTADVKKEDFPHAV